MKIYINSGGMDPSVTKAHNDVFVGFMIEIAQGFNVTRVVRRYSQLRKLVDALRVAVPSANFPPNFPPKKLGRVWNLSLSDAYKANIAPLLVFLCRWITKSDDLPWSSISYRCFRIRASVATIWSNNSSKLRMAQTFKMALRFCKRYAIYERSTLSCV